MEHGVTGFLADTEENSAGLLGQVLADPSRLAPVALAARRRIARDHSWEGHLDRLEQILAEVVAERQPSIRL